MGLDVRRIAANLRLLADAFEEDYQPSAAATGPSVPPAAAPAKRGRGRPVQGEPAPATAVQAPAAPVAAPAAEPDPFAAAPPAALPAPTATEAEVRAALTALRTATTQDNALAVLKAAGGASNLTELKPDKYGAVVAAAKAATAVPTPGKVEEDPFAAPEAAPNAVVYTLEDVKKAVVEATKRTGADRAAKVVMDLGGKAAKPEGGFGPSWTALPKEQYAAAIAGLNALPTTR